MPERRCLSHRTWKLDNGCRSSATRLKPEPMGMVGVGLARRAGAWARRRIDRTTAAAAAPHRRGHLHLSIAVFYAAATIGQGFTRLAARRRTFLLATAPCPRSGHTAKPRMRPSFRLRRLDRRSARQRQAELRWITGRRSMLASQHAVAQSVLSIHSIHPKTASWSIFTMRCILPCHG